MTQPTVVIYRFTDPYRLEASFGRAFRRLGWRVLYYDRKEDDDVSWFVESRVGRLLTKRTLTIRKWGTRQRNSSLYEFVSEIQPELVLCIKGDGVMPGTVRRLRDVSGRVAIFHPDSPFPGSPSFLAEHLEAALEADVVFIWSHRLRQRLRDCGASKVVYLPFAWDSCVMPFRGIDPSAKNKVVFIGSWDRRRERWLRPVAENFDLKIWGPKEWGERTCTGSAIRSSWRGGRVVGPEAANIIGQSGVVLNVMRRQNLPDGTNMRTFEVPGAGGFLLSNRSKAAQEIYPEGSAAAYFDSPSELVEKVGHYLSRPDERVAIAHRAHSITDEEHTYVDRVETILKACGLGGADDTDDTKNNHEAFSNY